MLTEWPKSEDAGRHYRKFAEALEAIRNDSVSLTDLTGLRPQAVVISPGPCSLLEAGTLQIIADRIDD